MTNEIEEAKKAWAKKAQRHISPTGFIDGIESYQSALRSAIEAEINSELPLNWDSNKKAYVCGLEKALELLDTVTPKK